MKLFRTTSLGFFFLCSLVAVAQSPAPDSPTESDSQEPFSPPVLPFVEGGSFLGVYAENISQENMKRYGLQTVRGVGITGIVKDSPAERAGLRRDDVIVRFDSEAVTSVRKLNRLVSEAAAEQQVKFGILRNGSEQEITVTIGKRQKSADIRGTWEELLPPNSGTWQWPGDDGPLLVWGSRRRVGVSTVGLTKQLADYFGVPEGKGLLVTAVSEESAAAAAGITAGDVITAVDGEKIESTGDLARAINRKKAGEVTLTIVRNKSARPVKLLPKEDKPQKGQSREARKAQRRIMIPSIELPSIPPVDVTIPQIDLPTSPEIDIELPRLPKMRLRRLQQQPI